MCGGIYSNTSRIRNNVQPRGHSLHSPIPSLEPWGLPEGEIVVLGFVKELHFVSA